MTYSIDNETMLIDDAFISNLLEMEETQQGLKDSGRRLYTRTQANDTEDVFVSYNLSGRECVVLYNCPPETVERCHAAVIAMDSRGKLTEWGGAAIIEAYLQAAPRPKTELQKTAAAALKAGLYDACKVYSTFDLSDRYLRGISYLSSVPTVAAKGMPQLATLLAEAASAFVDAAAEMGAGEASRIAAIGLPYRDAFQLVNFKIFSKFVWEGRDVSTK